MNRLFDRIPVLGKLVTGKIILSFLMLVFAFVMSLAVKGLDRTVAFYGMLFAFGGDLLLNFRCDKKSAVRFALGAASFAIAHLCYTFAYCYKMWQQKLLVLNEGLVIAFVLLVITTITVLGIAAMERRIKMEGLFFMGIGYLWITGLDYMIISAYGWSVKDLSGVIAIIGAWSFFASDLIIGAEKFFGLKSKIARELVWWLYPLGQIMIIAMA